MYLLGVEATIQLPAVGVVMWIRMASGDVESEWIDLD